MFSEDELIDIDEWRYENRIATRADAVRRLCKIALFTENELEKVVDTAREGVEVLSENSRELSDVFSLLINRETFGMTFDRDQLWDVFTLAREQADAAEQGVRDLHTTLVTMFNAIVAMVEARSLRGGQRKSQEIIEATNAAFEQAKKRRLEQEERSLENRFLGLIFHNELPGEREAYEALPDEEQEAFLEGKIGLMKEQQAADPVEFARRHGIDDRKFWEKPEWQALLDAKHEEQKG